MTGLGGNAVKKDKQKENREALTCTVCVVVVELILLVLSKNSRVGFNIVSPPSVSERRCVYGCVCVFCLMFYSFHNLNKGKFKWRQVSGLRSSGHLR